MSEVRALVLGEMANVERYQPPGWSGFTPRRQFDVMLQLQAFMDKTSTRKLRGIGLERSESCNMMNLMLPDDSKWDREVARRNFLSWADFMASYDVVFCAGNRVTAAATGRASPRLSESYGTSIAVICEKTIVVPIPHPSGLNLWWNHKQQVSSLKRKITIMTKKIRESKHD